MKIGIVCYPTYGGSGIVATELGMDLAEKGHEVHFFSTNVPARLNIKLPNIYFHRIHVETYPLFQYQPYDLALSTILYDKVLHYNIELVHVHYAIPHAYAAYFTKQMLARKGYHLPIVTTLLVLYTACATKAKELAPEPAITTLTPFLIFKRLK